MGARVLCFGAGGHARVVVDLLQACAANRQIAIVGMVGGPDDGNGDVLGVPILGRDEDLPRIMAETSATHFIVTIGTLRGGARLRPALFDNGLRAGLTPFSAIHPSAIVSARASVDPGATIMAAAVVQAGTRIGANSIINTRASVDHDCVVGTHAHVAPGAVCSGGVIVGEGAHIGPGAVVVQNIRIGDGATIGAGAVVLRNCEAGSVLVGNPARPLPRRLS